MYCVGYGSQGVHFYYMGAKLWIYIMLVNDKTLFKIKDNKRNFDEDMSDERYSMDPSNKFHNALDEYPTMHHFATQMCTHVHISVTKWCIVGYLCNAFGVYSTGAWVTKKISMLKSMLQTWHLIGWQHSHQPIRSHVSKSLLSNMEFNMDFI